MNEIAQISLLIWCISDSCLFTENEVFRFKINSQYNFKSSHLSRRRQVVSKIQQTTFDQLYSIQVNWLTLHSKQTAKAESPSKSTSSGHLESGLCMEKSTHAANSNNTVSALSSVAYKSRVLGDRTNNLDLMFATVHRVFVWWDTLTTATQKARHSKKKAMPRVHVFKTPKHPATKSKDSWLNKKLKKFRSVEVTRAPDQSAPVRVKKGARRM